MTKSPFYKREQNDAVVEKRDIKAGNLRQENEELI